jgi:signal transduction histidine kinase
MPKSPDRRPPVVPQPHLLLAYVADLELEVDRLRKQGQFVRQEARGALKRILGLCDGAADAGRPPPEFAAVAAAARGLDEALRDVQDPPGYHPAHDQVVAIAVRPLVEQVFRWQQRVAVAPGVALRLALEADHVEWFPARLRHVLDNLISNALRYRDPAKTESWVEVGVREAEDGYVFRVSDNGVGFPEDGRDEVFQLFYRAAPARAAGLGVGLAVVKMLVEQSGGQLTVASGQGEGSTFLVTLPRYDVSDFLV